MSREGVIERAEFGTTSCDPISTLIDNDLDNLDAVHEWALESGRIDDDLRLYRPFFALIFVHELTAPGRWAEETMKVDGIEHRPGFGALLDSARQAALSRFDDESYAHLVGLEMPGEDPTRDVAEAGVAYFALIQGEWDRGTHLFESADTGDPNTRFFAYYFGSLIPRFASEANDNADIEEATQRSIHPSTKESAGRTRSGQQTSRRRRFNRWLR